MPNRPSRRRPAYTLLEVVLVLALLAIVTALAYPHIDGMYGHHRLTAALDEVRGAWASGRAHAIEEGVPYRFSVVLGKGNFRLAPDSPEYWDGGNPAPAGNGQQALILTGSLPRGVTFANGNNGNGGGPGGSTDTVLESVSPSQYQALAVFLPDGTARDDVEIRFNVRGAAPAVIKLRSMTGVVSVQRGGGKP
jgi:prepilin-type N-terminal cleavage/methylation domain-containing protein